MDIKEIKNLAQVLKNNDLTLIEYCEGDKKIKIERKLCTENISQIPSIQNIEKTENNIPSKNSAIKTDYPVDFNNITEVKSPMVGVFYSAPSPDSKPYVKIGDRVKKGDVLCIIEAMKLMNEICAETEGEIVDICAENEQIVEFNQTLFKIY